MTTQPAAATPKTPAKAQRPEPGVFLVHSKDFATVIPFSSEKGGMRYALEHELKIHRVTFGQNLADVALSAATHTQPTTGNGIA